MPREAAVAHKSLQFRPLSVTLFPSPSLLDTLRERRVKYSTQFKFFKSSSSIHGICLVSSPISQRIWCQMPDNKSIFGNDNIWQLLCLRGKQSEETTEVFIEQRLNEIFVVSCSFQSYGTALGPLLVSLSELHLPETRSEKLPPPKWCERSVCHLSQVRVWVQLVVAGRMNRAQLSLLGTWHALGGAERSGRRRFRKQPLKNNNNHYFVSTNTKAK